MGSLMCCLNYVPELDFQRDPPMIRNEADDGSEEGETKNLFENMMDNMHYILPGL